MNCYENRYPIIKYDQVREYCLNEEMNEEYMRSLIYRDFCGGGWLMNMERTQACWKKVLSYIAVVLLLLLYQKVSGKAGRYVADMFSYGKLDPDNAYAWGSVRHITQLLLALAVILVISKLLKVNFYFSLGDRKKGIRFVVIYTVIFIGVTLVVHTIMMLNNSLPVYDYPLNKRNVLGTLGFQLFLSGPAEEVIYRALPITLLVYVSGKNIKIKWGITLETIIASSLFAFAHMKWSFIPFNVEMNYPSFFYAFAQGIISGKLYQDSRSVIYPMFIHSISNVLMVGTGYLFLLM